MVDPIKFTNFDRTDKELQETILFCLLVAGKNALTTAKLLNNLLVDYSIVSDWPFLVFKSFTSEELPLLLKQYGFGCYNNKAKGIYKLVRANLDLRTCTIEQLEEIPCISYKTSRFYCLHTRQNYDCIPLDTHILQCLADLGYDVPKSTPTKKIYQKLEKICIELAKKESKTCAEWDLETWNRYRSNK